MLPLRTATEFANQLMRGLVAAGRVIRVLKLEPDITDPATPLQLPDHGDLVDPVSGVRARDGLLTAIVSAEPDSYADARRPAGAVRRGKRGQVRRRDAGQR